MPPSRINLRLDQRISLKESIITDILFILSFISVSKVLKVGGDKLNENTINITMHMRFIHVLVSCGLSTSDKPTVTADYDSVHDAAMGHRGGVNIVGKTVKGGSGRKLRRCYIF